MVIFKLKVFNCRRRLGIHQLPKKSSNIEVENVIPKCLVCSIQELHRIWLHEMIIRLNLRFTFKWKCSQFYIDPMTKCNQCDNSLSMVRTTTRCTRSMAFLSWIFSRLKICNVRNAIGKSDTDAKAKMKPDHPDPFLTINPVISTDELRSFFLWSECFSTKIIARVRSNILCNDGDGDDNDDDLRLLGYEMNVPNIKCEIYGLSAGKSILYNDIDYSEEGVETGKKVDFNVASVGFLHTSLVFFSLLSIFLASVALFSFICINEIFRL